MTIAIVRYSEPDREPGDSAPDRAIERQSASQERHELASVPGRTEPPQPHTRSTRT